ncbi:MAG: ATP synthase F1 subunit gamma [Bacillota bacterium]|jgi:F-type H+-transporting ATPase subunit gamma
MASSRDIKRRIKSVKNMQQITKAMKMVSAAKLRKSTVDVVKVRPYLQKIEEVVAHLSQSEAEHPYMKAREVKKTGYLVLASNRGLCGSFNSNVLRLAENHIKDNSHPVGLITVGVKARDYFVRRGYKIDDQFNNTGDNPSYAQARELSSEIFRYFEEGQYDEVYVVYSYFRSAIMNTPKIKKILPIEPEQFKETDQDKFFDFIFEPNAEAILSVLIPQYIEISVYNALLESKASEHGARMTSMSSATDNAIEMIESLTLSLNRARQAAITKEISEIVGGAAALS